MLNFLLKRTNTARYQNITIAEYHAQFLNNHTDHTLVDVRTPGEYISGHLPGALNIPLHQLASRANEIPDMKPVVLVCATANRSATGSAILVRNGYTNVYNLRGGTASWMRQGLPVEQ